MLNRMPQSLLRWKHKCKLLGQWCVALYRARCGAYCERHLCDGDARIRPCILRFHCKRNYELTLHTIKQDLSLLWPSTQNINSTTHRHVHTPFLPKSLTAIFYTLQTMVGSLQYVIGRDEKVFPDPDSFKPERWLRESSNVSSTFASVPFGFGPRMCIGRRLAELELYLALARVCTHFISIAF